MSIQRWFSAVGQAISALPQGRVVITVGLGGIPAHRSEAPSTGTSPDTGSVLQLYRGHERYCLSALACPCRPIEPQLHPVRAVVPWFRSKSRCTWLSVEQHTLPSEVNRPPQAHFRGALPIVQARTTPTPCGAGRTKLNAYLTSPSRRRSKTSKL